MYTHIFDLNKSIIGNNFSDFRLDDGQVNGGDDQYDGGDYDKEPQQKNDIHLAEGEDEGEGNLMRPIE